MEKKTRWLIAGVAVIVCLMAAAALALVAVPIASILWYDSQLEAQNRELITMVEPIPVGEQPPCETGLPGIEGAVEQVGCRQRSYLEQHGEYGTFAQLVAAGLLDKRFAASDPPVIEGYTLTLRVTPRTDALASTFSLNADPPPGRFPWSGTGRHYYTDWEGAGEIYYEDGRPVAKHSESP